MGQTKYKNQTAHANIRRGKKKHFERSVSLGEIASLCRRFAIMQGAFISLPDSLSLLCEQTGNKALKGALAEVLADVTGGAFLSDALRKHGRIFPDFMCSMIYVGELGGSLAEVLSSLADYYEREVSIRRKFRSALEYPAIIFSMTLALAYLLLAFVVPTFKSTLGELDVKVTGLTAAVYAMSDFILNYGIFLILGIILMVFALIIFFKTEVGGYIRDTILLKLPLISSVQKNISASHLARSLGLLISSGLTLDEALSASEAVISNRYIKKRFKSAAECVILGESFAKALGEERIFPDTMVKMVEIGEETNSLDDVLLRSCSFLDLETEGSLTSLSSALGPVLLVIMGGVIGAMFLAVYSPILSVINAF